MKALESMGIEFNISERNYKQIKLEEFDGIVTDRNKIQWIHINLNQADTFKTITEKIKLPDDIIELCEECDSIPKLIDKVESLTLRIPCLLTSKIPGKHTINFGNLIIHLTEHYCLTITSHPIPALNSFFESYHRALKYAKTPCFILFLILDDVINDYANILYEFEVASDLIDSHLHTSGENPYKKVMSTKMQLMKVKRCATGIRDILMRISGRKIIVVTEQCRTSLNSLFEHSQMIVGEADAIREMLNGILDQIENALMHKMSESMKVLTAFAAIFLPLSLIAGIYGMNFRWIPELHWKYGYVWALSLMVAVAAVLAYFFKKNKWL